MIEVSLVAGGGDDEDEDLDVDEEAENDDDDDLKPSWGQGHDRDTV